jgi:HSP20 family protein
MLLNTMFTSDVRNTLDHFRRSVDQLFETFYGYPSERGTGPSGSEQSKQWTFSPVLESGWTDSHLRLRAILPGVFQNDVKVTVQNNQLVIEGERKAPEGFERNAYTQLAYGPFYTAVTLPSNLDVDKVKCRLHDGVLDIEIPVAETMKPRQIQIETESRKAIGA